MGKETKEQLLEQEDQLKLKSSSLQEAYSHLAEPGWVEAHLEKRTPREEGKSDPKFNRRLPNLRLLDVNPLTYFDRLERIKSRQLRIRGKSLPYLADEISEIRKKLEAMEIRTPSYGYILELPPQPLKDYSGLLTYPEMERFLHNADYPTRVLLQQLLESESSNPMFNAMVKYSLQTGAERIERQFFNQHLLGALFAEAGYLHLAPFYQRQGLILLSPSETLALYINANPQRQVMDDTDFGLNRNLKDKSTPDGLVISPTEDSQYIKMMVEYKFMANPSEEVRRSLEIQNRAFNHQQLSSDLKLNGDSENIYAHYLGSLIHLFRPTQLPNLPLSLNSELKTVYVMPSNATYYRRDTIIEPVPLRTGTLHGFMMILQRALPTLKNL